MENKPGVHKPDPILIADNVTRKFGGMTAVDVGHFEIERHGITALISSTARTWPTCNLRRWHVWAWSAHSS